MRWFLVLLFVAPAAAETRVGVHVGGGMDAGLMIGEPRPDGVAEAGITLDQCFGSWCIGGVLEAVGRQSEPVMPIAEELKLDVLARYRFARPGKPRGSFGFGAGLRNVSVEGNERMPAQSIRGYDLLRMETEIELARVGRATVHFYFAWTFGIYKDEMLGERFGDAPYPQKDVSAMTNAYVVGLRSAFHL